MKGIKTIFVLALLLSLSIPTAFSEDTFTVEYQFNPVPVDGCGQWMIEGTILQEIPGEPLVPYYSASILLPQGTDVKDVKVNPCTPIVQKGIDLPWGQPPCTFSDEPVKVGKNEEIYGSDDIYPNKLFDIVSVQSFRGFQILCINLFPVQYKPKSGTVKFYESLTVEVKFGKKMKNKLYRGLQGDKQDVTDIVDNLEMVGTYEDGPSPVQIEEYIIVTNDTMQSTFGELANWKDKYVNGTGVYTVSWITANYTGVDNAEKVRNFIIDMYTNHGTKYVLLGGDIAAVPYRGFYVSTGGYVDSDMLADMYFAHLDGNHNADGDSRWGEPNDNVDWYAEIAVGRAPCETITEAHNFVDKVIAYEQMDKPERVCLHQSRVQSGNSPDSRCLAWSCDDWIPGGYYVDYLFEEDGTVTKTRWINAWAANPAVVAHIGHGNTNVYHINYEVGGTVSWYNSDVPSLTNTFFPWTTSVACICGQIEANDCLAEAYVKDDCGAIAAIYNDNYGWFSLLNACQYSGEFCEMEFRACWSDGYEKFGDMLNQARSYLVSSAQSNSTYRWCFYERNLIGDPETPSLTWKPPPDDRVVITNPQDGQWICCGPVLITVSTTGCIDTVEFYIDSTLVFTDTAAPFEYLWDTTQYHSGQHTILVKGYCSGAFMDDDIITVITNNPPIYYVTITYPRDGQTVSGIVTVTTETNCDEVRFYLNGKLKHTDYTAPFTWDWDTTQYKGKKLKAEGYCSGVLVDSDQIKVKISNSSIALLSLLVFFLSAGIYRRR